MVAPYQSRAHHDHHTDATEGKEELSQLESTYTSLIQQYLAVLRLDNAIFFAERLVAASRTNHSLLLLATCYYRQGKPQRAKAILEDAKTPSPAMLYLLAQAYYDLQQYGAAEEALLRQSRVDYRSQQENVEISIQEYILTTSVSQGDCSCSVRDDM